MEKMDISQFIKNIWFFVLYFVILLLIASFGTVAEAATPMLGR
jgi:hypothetical protein